MKRDRIISPDVNELLSQSFETLVADIANGHSERIREYFTFSAKFHKYSPENKLLIFQQYPTATRVAGYRTWQQEGYQVAKGQKGIRIKAPIVKKDEDEVDGKRIVGFFEVTVFDVSQLTEDKRPPTFFPEVHGNFDQLYAAMHHAITAGGIQVVETVHTNGAQGYSALGTIALKKGLPSGNK